MTPWILMRSPRMAALLGCDDGEQLFDRDQIG
jgi:hypothetical protein